MKKHVTDVFVVLTLFFAYTASAMLLCAIGAGVYQRTADGMQKNYDMRTGVLYVAEKIRQNDVVGGLRIDQIQEKDALVLVDQTTDDKYETWIFVDEDGNLREAMVSPGNDVKGSDGYPIMPMKSMQLSIVDGSMLDVQLLTGEDELTSIRLAPLCALQEVSG